jgi:hypothetical protein
MARKVVNRKVLREQSEAAEAAGGATEEKKPKKKAAKRKSRAKAAVDLPKRLHWGVFNQSLKIVELFDFNQKKEADKKADELNKAGKSQHFVQKVKKDIEPVE